MVWEWEISLEIILEYNTGSKVGKEYDKAVYCRHAYLTFM